MFVVVLSKAQKATATPQEFSYSLTYDAYPPTIGDAVIIESERTELTRPSLGVFCSGAHDGHFHGIQQSIAVAS